MVEDCRREVSIGAQRNPNHDVARVIQCRAVARRMHRMGQGQVNKLDSIILS